ncbi:MAG: glycoside hydrolase family 5 protein, partial [Acetobacteraceae bacterium]
MTTRFRGLGTLALLLALLLVRASAWASPPLLRLAALARGVNITNWFRFPASTAPAAIGAYLSDAAMADLHRAGFTFVRLPFDPMFAASRSRRDLLVAQVRRLQVAGLAVILVPVSATWRLEDRPADRAALLNTWRNLAPALRALPPDRTFPEAVNEPVFPVAAAWADLQLRVLTTIRDALPANTVVLDGANWSSLHGLEALAPAADPDVVYSVHFYDPAELTSLAAYRTGLDRAA